MGFIAGGLARMATGARKRGCLGTIAVGILGALVGGAIFRFATGDEVDAFNDLDGVSILVAFVGACALLLLLDALGGRRRSIR
jgi:uncharacterized membrane protein YeaQ/YmgE (transglycosylase-associated protein family)